MSNSQRRVKVSYLVFVLVASLQMISHFYVEGRHVLDKNEFGAKPKGTVKSIKVPEDGDVIDCVFFRQQPAFDHPLLKDLQTDLELMDDDETPEFYQNWHKYGNCPKGTVPIRRTKEGHIHKKQLDINSPYAVEEYATARQPDGIYQGTSACINLWNPKVQANEYSSAQIWVQSGTRGTGDFAAIEAGWTVYPSRYNDSQTRLFIHWTNDDYVRGCFDLDCPGFVQTTHQFALGYPFQNTSSYDRDVWESVFNIYKSGGAWYLKIQKIEFGYWPGPIVSRLQDHADTVVWGGVILNSNPNRHTTTEMGSGHFSIEGNRKAAFVRNLGVINNSYVTVPASNIQADASNPTCYDVTVGNEGTAYETHFYFGGPGFSRKCP